MIIIEDKKMEALENNIRKKGVSIVSREAAENRRAYFLKQMPYWEEFAKKRGMHKVIKNTLWNMQETHGEFLITPRPLEHFFLLYLNKFHPSQQNIQRALNLARVYAILVHQYYHSAENYNMVASFFVSPSIWRDWLIGRKAKENCIAILEEMGVIFSYRYNLNKHAPAEESRIVIMYQFKLKKVKWLYACVKTLLALKSSEEPAYGTEREVYTYDEIMEDLFGYIAKAEVL